MGNQYQEKKLTRMFHLCSSVVGLGASVAGVGLGSGFSGKGVDVAGMADTGLEEDVPQARLNRALNRRLR